VPRVRLLGPPSSLPQDSGPTGHQTARTRARVVRRAAEKDVHGLANCRKAFSEATEGSTVMAVRDPSQATSRLAVSVPGIAALVGLVTSSCKRRA
jgi:hypothetical protein